MNVLVSIKTRETEKVTSLTDYSFQTCAAGPASTLGKIPRTHSCWNYLLFMEIYSFENTL
jgi:hypothetical protein